MPTRIWKEIPLNLVSKGGLKERWYEPWPKEGCSMVAGIYPLLAGLFLRPPPPPTLASGYVQTMSNGDMGFDPLQHHTWCPTWTNDGSTDFAILWHHALSSIPSRLSGWEVKLGSTIAPNEWYQCRVLTTITFTSYIKIRCMLG
jgi:hypothetical protein